MKNTGRGKIVRAILLFVAIAVAVLSLAACTLADPDTTTKYQIINNEENAPNINKTTRDQAIDNVTNGLDSLRSYLDRPEISNTGYYMGVEFNINTEDTRTHVLSNFRLKVQAHLFTYKYEDDDGNLIYKYLDKRDGKYYDAQNAEGTREKISAQDIHNEAIKKSDILIEWYDGISNEMLIGLYYDGINGNSDDPGNIMYLNIQGYKRSFIDWGDTVLYQQLIRLLMSLSIEKLLVAANIQGDSGTSSIRSVFELLVTDNYKTVVNGPETSTLFYDMNATPIAGTLTDFIQRIFRAFRNDQTNEYPLDPFTDKYLGFKFSVMGAAVLNAIATDMQFFTEPDPTDGTSEILTGAHLTFDGSATSLRNNYSYVSDASFEYGAYPPEDIKLDRSFYTVFEYGKYEFTGNLYVPLINSNFDALIRTDMQQFYNYQNNIFMEYRDIANGELMMGAYYRGDIAASPDVQRINKKGEIVDDKQGRTFVDITGMEYLYGWIDLNQLGFPKVYDEHINLADQLDSFHSGLDRGIVSIVDSILSPDKNDKENMLMTYLMRKMSKTEKVDGDIFSRNTETLLVDMELIKQFLRETGVGDYTTRQVINILDSMLPYTMDQIAIMLGVANAEIMLDNSFFTFRLDVDTNEIRICMYTNVNRTEEEGALMIFQLDLVPVIFGEQVNIADLNFDNYKPLEQIYTYSATMDGNFVFSTAEVVDLSKLLSATIGENSGLNTPYTLAQNAGITFRLIYDQFVTDHEIEGVMRYQGRSAFQLTVWLTGSESSVIIRIASDDVSFSNDVYEDQPARAEELGYVWVSIECVTDYGVQRVPKVKVREDVFMSSMQAYMNGTKISDNAADLGNSEVNLSITSILFALIEDSYVVMEPEQIEITSSNETLQNLFRVKGLIGNIRADAGFTHRVSGLQSIRDDYGLYQVGQFDNIVGNSPYDTELHHTVPVYFYDDYINYHFIKPNRETFDSFTPNKTSEGLDGYNLGQKPKDYTWDKSNGALGDTERSRLYGIYNSVTDSDEKLTELYTDIDGSIVFDYLPEDFDVRAFLTIDGENSLVMSNKTVYGQHYKKTDPVVIESATYYKITFKAKTLLPAGSNAEFRFFVNTENNAYQSIVVDTSKSSSVYAPVDYTIYIDNPTKDYFMASWGFYLGDSTSGVSLVGSRYTTGMLVVDKILFCQVDEKEFAAASAAYDALGRDDKLTASTRVYTYSTVGTSVAERPVSYDPLKYDLRVDRARGMIQVYEKGGRVSVYRENIDYANDSFFVNEDANNQDISRVRFKIESLPFIYKINDKYYFTDYDGEEVVIDENYIRTEASQTYVYFLGVQKRVHHLGGAEYCYYDGDRALLDGDGEYITFYTQVNRDFLFEYDAKSIEITEQAKTQYAPRINGSFMGEIRRYILVLTSPLAVERGKLIELYDRVFYSEEDENHSIQLYDEDGVAIGDPIPDPIVLFVMEPCEPLSEEVAVNIQVNNNVENYVLPARFVIDWDAVTLKGDMVLTDVIVAPGMMGEQSFPVRIIVTNREISPLNDDTVSVYVEQNDSLSENVPVVDYIEIDPYDYIIAKNNYFMNIGNYNPDQYGDTGDDPEYLRKYREKEADFVKQFFSGYVFTIRFRGDDSILYSKIDDPEKKNLYVAYEYTNLNEGELTTYDWAFDAYSEGNYTEDKIKAVADGGATHTALYLHTYFKGQLIAIQVNVMTRKLSHVKFSEDDDFDPVAANPGKEPGDQGYIYGHYVANYFDEESYFLPIQPIFVFTDGAGHYFEKVFDMSYISALASNGSYIIDEQYWIEWGNPLITYIGANGSYYYKEVWCVDDLTSVNVGGKLLVESCDDNLFLSDDFAKHTDAEGDAAQIAYADAVGEAFESYRASSSWGDYNAFFDATKVFFDNASNGIGSGKLFGVDTFDFSAVDKTVLLDLTHGVVKYDGPQKEYLFDQWASIVCRLFGLEKDAFITKAAEIAAALSAAVSPEAFEFDGAIYTPSGDFVLPYAFRYYRDDGADGIYKAMLALVIVDVDGNAWLFINGASEIEDFVNAGDVNYALTPVVKVYGRCQLAQEGKILINRPFDLSMVVRDENGNILSEGDPIELYPSDVTSASINWFDLFTIYKPQRVLGEYQGRATEIHLIAGDETYSGFMPTVIRITVECPKLTVANVTSDGVDVLEADDNDFDAMSNKVIFTPSYVDFGTGTNPGYYFIDPLDASTLELPDSIIIGFTDETNDRLSSHRFVNIQWRATFEKADGNYVGNGSLTNDSGVQILRYDEQSGKYYFNLSTEEPMYTRIMAKIGSDLSGYQYITVCVRVLSKDPQEVEFYYGAIGTGTRLTAVERTDVEYSFSSADNATEFAFYTYYVDTFTNFRMPTYIKAYFGVSKEREAFYNVTWRAANGDESVYYRPDSVCNMVAEIGTGDIVIYIYLSVVVANYTIDHVELTGGLEGYFVRVGNVDNYVRVEDLLISSFGVNPQIGLYVTDGIVDQYILINTENDEASGLVAGMIPLYASVNGRYELRRQLYPYDFIEQVYSSMSLFFNNGNAVTLPDIGQYYGAFYNAELDRTYNRPISDATTVTYSYDASSGKDKLRVTVQYVYAGYGYYLVPDANGIVTLSADEGNSFDKPFSLYEIALLSAYLNLAQRYDEKIIETIVTPTGDIDLVGQNIRLGNLYDKSSGTFAYLGEELTFLTISFEDGTTAGNNELVYRMNYLNKHRNDDYSVGAIRNKTTVINDFEGIFSVNDVVRPIGRTFVASDRYVVSLGTGRGAYDLRLKLVFDGGYRLTEDSEVTQDIVIAAYTPGGFAQYGARGYLFGDEVIVNIGAVAQDGRGVVEQFFYGSDSVVKDRLDRWYVESSTFDSLTKGTFITGIPQSIIYSSRNGTVVVSTLTKEGFRIRRTLTFDGIPTSLTEFESINKTGLQILDGDIRVTDIYDYMPLTTYFAGTKYLPTTIVAPLGSGTVTVSNVEWTILESWYGATTEDSLGRRIGAGELDRMTYNGTYNSTSGTLSRVAMATAEVLGWMDESGAYHDRLTITLTVTIPSAEIVSLPWNTGNLALETRTITEEDGGYRFYVDVDALLNAGSSAISGSNFELPGDIAVSYRSGYTHNFHSVSYRYNDLYITSIPYDQYGIDTAALAETFGVGETYFPYKDHIDLKVNVGLNQVLNVRFMFYDKTVQAVSAVLEVNDTVIREQIREELSDKATDKNVELLARFNTTRIKTNVETMYAAARDVREAISMPTVDDLFAISRSDLTVNAVKAVLYQSNWFTVLRIDDAPEAVDFVKTTPYVFAATWNYALDKIQAAAAAAAETYSKTLYDIIAADTNLSQRRTNATRQLENYVAAVYNNGYDAIIGDYLKLEMEKVFREELASTSISFVSNAVAFKNEAEGLFDYETMIKYIYRFREHVAYDKQAELIIADVGSEEAYAVQYLGDILKMLIYNASAAAAKKVAVSTSLRNIVDTVVRIRMGVYEDTSDEYDNDCDIATFISNNYGENKRVLRIKLREYIAKLFDFTVEKEIAAVTEINAMVPLIVADGLNAIQNYSITVAAIRRNLNTSVDISAMLNTLLSRGVKTFVDEVYMESNIVSAIKRAQKKNLRSTDDYGYYYIDPYYDFRLMPTRLVASFDEATGGFDYVFTASWISDTVSGNVTYSGNKRLDSYGYFYAYYNAYNTYLTKEDGEIVSENALLRLIMLDTVLPAVSGKTVDQIHTLVGSKTFDKIRNDLPSILGKSWAELRAANAIINDVMVSIEKSAGAFFGDVNDGNRDARYMELFLYYRAGIVLLGYSDAVIDNNYGMDAAVIRRDYDKYRYDDLNANLVNPNTRESQTVSLIVEVDNRTLAQGELIVLDDLGATVRSYEIENPFLASVADIPNRVKVAVPKKSESDPDEYEYLEIIWSNVQIGPAGNYSSVSSGNNYIRGYIGNKDGQEITLPIYIDRWEYAGVYELIDGEYVLMNTGSDHVMDFYFNDYLTYSAKDTYQVRFNVYRITKDGNKYVESDPVYMTKVFYPEDSALLVNSDDDAEMADVLARRKYVLYWDEMAVAQVLSNKASSITGSLFIGNDDIGKHNVTSLSVGSTNPNLAKTADYHYERMKVEELALSTLSVEVAPGEYQDVWQYGLDGATTVVIDACGTLPMTGEVKLFINNIVYDENEIEVRVLWNKTFNAAVNALVNFIEYAFPDVESAARVQYARSLLLDEYGNFASNRDTEVYLAALDYVKMRDPSLSEEGAYLAADQLLMVNEKYDYTTFVDRLRGGSYANETVDVVIRYAGSSNLYVQENYRVRVVFADYSPLAYYKKSGDVFIRIDAVEAGVDPNEVLNDLYIGVRKQYWYSSASQDAYTYEGLNTPYDNIGATGFKLLEQTYNVDYGIEDVDGLHLVHVTDVTYQEGTLRSESFVLGGVTYRSGLIHLR